MELASVIKYEGDNKTFVWKHPCEDFNSMSQLIVHESQEAALYVDGKLEQIFQSGKYTLETQNLPFLRRIISTSLGGKTPFHCEIYFVNKATQMAVRWGTDTKLEYMDPVYQFPIKLGANGEMALKVSDSKKLLIHLVGTETSFEQERLTAYFRAFLLMRIKSYIARIMQESKLDVFQLDENIMMLSDAIQKQLADDFEEYGISLVRFLITGIVKPDGDPVYEKFKLLHFRQYADIADAKIRQQVGIIDQQTASQRMVINAQGIANKRKIEGYTYQQERQFDVAEKAAANPGTGEFASAGIGLGMMTGIGAMIGKTVNGMFEEGMRPAISIPSQPNEGHGSHFCAFCGKELGQGVVYCVYCGQKIQAEKTICPECKHDLEASWQFCPKCGWKKESS